MDNNLLLEAKALYKDRTRIVLSALIILFSLTFYLYYTSGLAGLETISNNGIIQGIQVVAAFNNVGLLLAIALMVIVYQFWLWAFLPGPASLFTKSILRGILGSKVDITQTIGKKFYVTLEGGLSFCVSCSIHDKNADDWFSYRLISDEMKKGNLRNIALRHGFSLKDNRFVANVSNDELHHRTFLLAKAMMVATASL
ncbi:MAG: hypothetical protein ACFFDD_11485 [Promethearchaeota archaeon]